MNHLGKYESFDIEYKGSRIRVYVFGSGEKTILSLPSFPHSGLFYLWFVNHYDLSGVRFITFDLPGWIGKSDNIFNQQTFDMDEYVEIAKRVLDFFKVEEYGLIGYSFGGALSVKLAAEDMKRVGKIVLVSTMIDGELCRGCKTDKFLSFLYRLKLGRPLKTYVEMRFGIYRKVLKSENFPKYGIDLYEKMISKCDGGVLLKSIYTLFKTDWTEYLKKLKGKEILVVSSKNETAFLRIQSEHTRRVLDGEKSLFLEGSHEDFILRPSEATVRQVMEFVLS